MSMKYGKTPAGIAVMLLLSLGFAATAAAQEESLEDRVRTLEVQVQTLIQLLSAQNPGGGISVIQRSGAPGAAGWSVPGFANRGAAPRAGFSGSIGGRILGRAWTAPRSFAPSAIGLGARQIPASRGGVVFSFGLGARGGAWIGRHSSTPGAFAPGLRGGPAAPLPQVLQRFASGFGGVASGDPRSRLPGLIGRGQERELVQEFAQGLRTRIESGLVEEQASALRSRLVQILEILTQRAGEEEPAQTEEQE